MLKGVLLLKSWRVSSWGCFLIFVIGTVFLWFRKTDGAGVQNSLLNQLVSIGIWAFIFIIIFIIHLIWWFSLRKK